MSQGEAITIATPFTHTFAVDINLSVVGITEATKLFENHFGRLPDALFVGQDNFEKAEAILRLLEEHSHLRRLTVQYVPFYQKDWWSVGTIRPFYGFGSKGA